MAVPVPVAAQPSPEASGAATAADQQPGTTVCDITADGLQEISGLVAIDGGFFAIPDDGDTVDVFQLDSACEVVAEFSFDNDPRDTEDLAMAADGALWIADTGDNAAAEEDFDDARETVALWRITPDRSDIAIYRFTYPDQPHDAEALIVEPDGTPVIGRTRYPNLYLNTGHGTLGWTMACGSARVLADIIGGQAPEIETGDLALARYA